MRYQKTAMSGMCGVNIHRSFQTGEPGLWSNEAPKLGGANLACAAFIPSETCRLAYEELAKKFNIVYQSSVRTNRNSGNKFFFVVYDGKRRQGV